MPEGKCRKARVKGMTIRKMVPAAHGGNGMWRWHHNCIINTQEDAWGEFRERTLKAPTEKPILAFALIGQYFVILASIML